MTNEDLYQSYYAKKAREEFSGNRQPHAKGILDLIAKARAQGLEDAARVCDELKSLVPSSVRDAMDRVL